MSGKSTIPLRPAPEWWSLRDCALLFAGAAIGISGVGVVLFVSDLLAGI
ncbi:hypothetical protein [Gluconacetobacter diazotrophicus]|nr:hypothetical protein [Gluconacetobacter diazotrophicus]TWB00392.1 hypothetical protein FBZ86_1376 [Gluconacetobacter diazotrophicus]